MKLNNALLTIKFIINKTLRIYFISLYRPIQHQSNSFICIIKLKFKSHLGLIELKSFSSKFIIRKHITYIQMPMYVGYGWRFSLRSRHKAILIHTLSSASVCLRSEVWGVYNCWSCCSLFSLIFELSNCVELGAVLQTGINWIVYFYEFLKLDLNLMIFATRLYQYHFQL